MPSVEIRPFSDEFLERAGTLLADRQRRHADAEPLLSTAFDYPAEVEAAWRAEGASGAVALADGEVAGFVVGAPRPGDAWGPNVWIEAAGHAVAEPELARDLYGAAAGRWVDEGRTAHYVLVPATDAQLVQAWFRNGFGQQHVHAIREVPPAIVPGAAITVRSATTHDLDALVPIGRILPDLQNESPTFSRPATVDLEAERSEWAEEIEDERAATLVAEVDGRVAGVITVAPVEYSGAHAGLARPANASILGFAATLGEVRGRGAGIALTDAVFAWSRERGYETIVVDWRATNLSSSRFWPARGFRESFLRLYRSIP